MEPDELSTGPLWLKYDGEQSTRAEPGRQINHRLFLTELKRGPTPPQKQYRPDKLQTRTFQNLIKLILTPTLKRERERERDREKGKGDPNHPAATQRRENQNRINLLSPWQLPYWQLDYV